jgi:hypothetical protein
MQNLTEPGLPPQPEVRTPRTVGVFATSSAVEAVTGVGALVLAIHALAGVLPGVLLPIATIAVGVALLSESAAPTVAHGRLSGGYAAGEVPDMGGGTGAGFVGGGVAIVLGVLSLLGMSPGTLLSIAAIVLGACALLGASSVSLADRYVEGTYPTHATGASRDAVYGASGVQALAGVAATILGILALVGVAPTATLLEVSMIILGGTLVLSGGAIGARAKAAARR